MPKRRQRGIFALEGEWHSDLRSCPSFRPILELISKVSRCPFVHRDAATREELYYYLDKWTQKRYERFAILYLGFHGKRESILIGDGGSRSCAICLNELADNLAGRCANRIIYIGSCQTMSSDSRKLNSFLRKTGALALCGYREEVDMLRSAAFELLLFDVLLRNSLTIHGARAMKKYIEREERHLCRDLGFRMVVRKSESLRCTA